MARVSVQWIHIHIQFPIYNMSVSEETSEKWIDTEKQALFKNSCVSFLIWLMAILMDQSVSALRFVCNDVFNQDYVYVFVCLWFHILWNICVSVWWCYMLSFDKTVCISYLFNYFVFFFYFLCNCIWNQDYVFVSVWLNILWNICVCLCVLCVFICNCNLCYVICTFYKKFCCVSFDGGCSDGQNCMFSWSDRLISVLHFVCNHVYNRDYVYVYDWSCVKCRGGVVFICM